MLPTINNKLITSIGIIGSGNVAWHLTHGFLQSPEVTISWIYGRNGKTLSELASSTGVEPYLKFPDQEVDLILICISDDKIQEILNQLPENAKIAYTSGTVSLDKLIVKQRYCGVFYPLQTFTKNRTINLEEIPFLIESNHSEFTKELTELAKTLSNNVQQMNSEQRKQLHISAIFSNNFVNHLLLLAEEHLKDKNINKAILYPLIKETINKALDLGPFDSQSGPARRSDKQTIQTHLSELEGVKKDLYRLISESIEKTYSK